jgi:predicted acyl esterase
MNYYVRGPWRHSGVNYEQRNLGPIKFPGDTATAFRREVLKPFLDEHLKTNGAKANTPPVYFFETGMDRWQKMDRWPTGLRQRLPISDEEDLSDGGQGPVVRRAQGQPGL